jgi:hypothetical protein
MFQQIGDEPDLCTCGQPVKMGLCGRCGEIPDDCVCPDTCGYCGLPNEECMCDEI